ncbi:recombination protein RecR [bacterium]|nr:recombination protein RecR [bacterium]
MEYASKVLGKLVEAFSRFPGIGEKSAQRMAFYLLKQGREESERLAKAILDLNENVGQCSICFNLTEEDPCSICSDTRRDRSIICVVEEPKDILAIERSGTYRGLFHVLGGVLSPLDGIGEDQLHISELLSRVDGEVEEIILATNPTMEGEMTAAHIAKKLEKSGVKVTRIARGIPFGGSLEFNDAVTVAKALEGRVNLEQSKNK